MEWEPLEREPQVGDVLIHENGLIGLVVRRMPKSGMRSSVDVFWLWTCNDDAGDVSTHYGGLSTWASWSKLSVETSVP